MGTETLRHPGGGGRVVQFSVFVANKLGRLRDLTALLRQHDVHILGLTVLDTTDSAIVRAVVDDPERARDLFHEHGFAFTESAVVVIEVDVETRLEAALLALLEAEINIHHVYAFLALPNGRPLLALNVEDHELAAEALERHRFRVLTQGDLSR